MAKNNLTNDLKRQSGQFLNLVKVKIPNKTAEKLEQFYKDSFTQEQNAFKKSGKWESTKAKNASEKREADRGGILVKSGALMDSATTDINGTQVSLQAGYDVGKWNLAEIHNEGLSPQKKRQFMPMPGEESPELMNELETFIDAQMDKIFS